MADPYADFTILKDQPTPGQRAANDSYADFHILDSGPPEDGTSGAPMSVRARVGSVPEQISTGAGPDLRLQAIQKVYPDAQPYGSGNFVYTDPSTGKKTLYNPPGLDFGDMASIIPQAAEAVGGAAGAVGGGILGLAGGPPGVVAGAMGGAGAGATLAREGVERGSLLLQGIPDTRSAAEQGLNALPTFTMNAAGEGAGLGLRETGKAILRGKGGRREVLNAMSDASRFGFVPSAAGVTENSALDSLESFAASVPGGVGVIRQKAKEAAAAVSAAVKAKAKALAGKIDPIAAGNAATEGVEQFAKDFGDKADVLYSKLDTFIPQKSQVGVTNTQAALSRLAPTNPSGLSEPLINPKLVKMRDGLLKDSATNGTVAYADLAANRSMIGRKLGNPSLVDDIPRAELKQVYAALTADMRAAAQAQGPDALKAFDRANGYYKAGIERIDNLLEPLIKNKLPEQVFAAIQSSAEQGPSRLRALRKSVSPEQWRVIAGNVVNDIGTAQPGQQGVERSLFSFQKFLSNWQKLDDGAKDALFNGPGMGGIRGDLDALARTSERITESSKAYANPSGSARNIVGGAMMMAGTGAAVTGDPGIIKTIIGAVGAGWIAARLLTSPKTSRWLAQGVRAKGAGITEWIGRGVALAADADPGTREAVQQFLSNIDAQGAMQFTPPGGQRVN